MKEAEEGLVRAGLHHERVGARAGGHGEGHAVLSQMVDQLLHPWGAGKGFSEAREVQAQASLDRRSAARDPDSGRLCPGHRVRPRCLHRTSQLQNVPTQNHIRENNAGLTPPRGRFYWKWLYSGPLPC